MKLIEEALNKGRIQKAVKKQLGIGKNRMCATIGKEAMPLPIWMTVAEEF